MNWKNVWIIFVKELRESFRDKTVIFTNFVFPFVYTLMMGVLIGGLGSFKFNKIQSYEYNISFSSPEDIPSMVENIQKNKKNHIVEAKFQKENSENLNLYLKLIQQSQELDSKVPKKEELDKRISDLRDSLLKLMSREKIDLMVLTHKKTHESWQVILLADLGSGKARSILDSVKTMFNHENKLLITKRLNSLGKDWEFIRPYQLEGDAAQAEVQIAGGEFSKTTGLFIALLLLLAMYYPTINATIGEKTKFTLRPLLMNPLGPMEILMGKYINIAFQGILGTVPYGIISFLGLWAVSFWKNESLIQNIPGSSFLVLALAVFSLALLISAICFLVAIMARTLTQAQALLSGAMFLILIPAIFIHVLELKLDLISSFLPFVNFALFFKDLLFGEVNATFSSIVILSNVTYSLFILGLAVQIFTFQMVWSTGHFTLSEMISFRRIKLEKINPALSFLLFFLLSLGIFISATIITGPEHGQLLVNPILISLGLSLLILRYYHLDIFKTINLRPISVKQFISALSLAGALVPILLPFAQIFSVPGEVAKEIAPALGSTAQLGLGYKLLAVALFAGVCEEVAFRGVILRGLLTSFPPFFSLIMSAIMFGVIHFDLIKFFPTAAIGLILGIVALRGGLIPCIIIHVVYNGILVVVDHYNVPMQLITTPGPLVYNVLYYLSLIAVIVFSMKQLRKEKLSDDKDDDLSRVA
ncbi:MAG: CPBP family glutamic-type intramembrane protease [Pseudomonadota bacterium]